MPEVLCLFGSWAILSFFRGVFIWLLIKWKLCCFAGCLCTGRTTPWGWMSLLNFRANTGIWFDELPLFQRKSPVWTRPASKWYTATQYMRYMRYMRYMYIPTPSKVETRGRRGTSDRTVGANSTGTSLGARQQRWRPWGAMVACPVLRLLGSTVVALPSR